MRPNYKFTKISCYFASFVQAAVINIWPLLFVTLKNAYGLSYTKLASLGLINFVIQLTADLIFSKSADKHGYKRYMLLALALVTAGFGLFAAAPLFFSDPYVGFLLATAVFSLGGGLLEIMTSPLIASLPTDSKSGSMALLHSFYAWGQAAVILLTTLALTLLGGGNWQFIVIGWAVMPLAALVMFIHAPTPQPLAAEKREKSSSVVKNPAFWLCFLIIFFGAGVEGSMVQWSSTFMERAMGLPKLLGDYGGMLMFALCLGASRLISALFSKKIVLVKFMFRSSLLAIACYLTVALTTSPAAGLIACGLTGFASGMLWPGTLVLAEQQFPRAGAWLFAMMAVGGDCGAAFCPWLAGIIADNADKLPLLSSLAQKLGGEELGLRAAMAFSAVFAVITAVMLAALMHNRKKNGLS